jgi:hypothetical protein
VTLPPKPYPRNATGEFLLVNCFRITGTGAANITLAQALTATFSTVTPTAMTQIQANPGLMTVWRKGSWFLAPSQYNPANTTYVFDAIAGTNDYYFFYGALTQPVGSQTGGLIGGTALIGAGGVPGEDGVLPTTVADIAPRVALIATGITLLLALGFLVLTDRKKRGAPR